MSTLDRITFETSRELEFFSESELQMQIGHGPNVWPIALVKELIDNALDACEDVSTPPEVNVTVRPDMVAVSDNGPGLPAETLEESLDYIKRVSDKTHYIGPTRGQLGNALKCVWAAPFVATPSDHGRVDVVTGGTEYRVLVTLDKIEGKPELDVETRPAPAELAKTGTTVRLHWTDVASYLDGGSDRLFYDSGPGLSDLVREYGAFNPHLRLTVEGETEAAVKPTAPKWDKWAPSDPTSAHWYSPEAFADLVAAHIAHERRGGDSMTVREFVGTFDGLSGPQAQRDVLDGLGLKRTRVSDLQRGGEVDRQTTDALLEAMKERARPVRPKRLGKIGEEHMLEWLSDRCNVETHPESVEYKVRYGDEGLPCVVEVAFAPFNQEFATRSREVASGVNWTPAIGNPFGDLLSDRLNESRVEPGDPVALAVHVATPNAGYTDRGKTKLDLPPEAEGLLDDCVRLATKDWTKEKKAAQRRARKRQKRREEAEKESKPFPHMKAACYHFMEQAYMAASDGGDLPANARQIMYEIRQLVKEAMGKFYKDTDTFTQDVLPQYLGEHPELDWDVVYDSRGRLVEPHTREEVPLGTVEVRNYLRKWTSGTPRMGQASVDWKAFTSGPSCRYAAALFIEKEGFTPLLREARIAERFDVAIFSTKGQSVTAARRLAEELAEAGVPIFVLHDFDKQGIEILDKLRTDTKRYSYDTRPELVDLGLRLPDVENMGLEGKGEPVSYDSEKDPRENLKACGASGAEQEFLRSGGRPENWEGRRVELNAMTSRQFIDFIESGLQAEGTEKVVPGEDVLSTAWERAHHLRRVRKELREARGEETDAPPLPDNAKEQVREAVSDSPKSWEDAVWALAEEMDGS